MDDKKKSGLNAFAGRKVGGSGKYGDLHRETLRYESAQETTDRINQFYAQNKTLEWARRAFDFCDREEENGKDIHFIFSSIFAIIKERLPFAEGNLSFA